MKKIDGCQRGKRDMPYHVEIYSLRTVLGNRCDRFPLRFSGKMNRRSVGGVDTEGRTCAQLSKAAGRRGRAAVGLNAFFIERSDPDPYQPRGSPRMNK
ncbi:hypothetical protein EVAR_35409_1 [Eumeta japonica]|uniref:Uncharacterized protein n=1 Tax=Eumeta variegata TaxID=151549 RepID=A0A4C1X8U1_EUMVA|nr:hypothetical protein EVAR_35409_1 [Eumeta japonica]